MSIKEEKIKLHAMTQKDRIWYIWEYYKLHIIGFIIAVFVLVSIGSSLYRNRFDNALSCAIINNRSAQVNTAPLSEGFADYLNIGKNQQIMVDSSTYIGFDEKATEYSYASMAKLSALISAHDLDIIICDQAVFDHYASMDGFLDLKTTLSPELYDMVQPHLISGTSEDGSRSFCGISLGDTSFANDCQLSMDTQPILGIISNSTRIDNSVALVQYIFE